MSEWGPFTEGVDSIVNILIDQGLFHESDTVFLSDLLRNAETTVVKGRESKQQDWETATILYEKGAEADYAYLLNGGLALEYSQNGDGVQRGVREVEKGEWLGLHETVAKEKYFLSAQVIKDAALIRVPAEDIQSLFSTSQEFRDFFLRSTKYLGEAMSWEFQDSGHVVSERLIAYLYHKVRRNETRPPSNGQSAGIELPTYDVIAAMIHTTWESIARGVSPLAEQGLIERPYSPASSNGRLTITDPEGIKREYQKLFGQEPMPTLPVVEYAR